MKIKKSNLEIGKTYVSLSGYKMKLVKFDKEGDPAFKPIDENAFHGRSEMRGFKGLIRFSREVSENFQVINLDKS